MKPCTGFIDAWFRDRAFSPRTPAREVEEQGSLTAAARKLGLTQSALSHAVRKLEDQLGAELWKGRAEGFGSRRLVVTSRLSRSGALPQFEHAQHVIAQMARGERGTLRIGMECHPCYRWLLKVAEPYLRQFSGVDLDVKQRFQFGGIGALFACEIDMLVTPDPLRKKGLCFEPVFDYEQVLVVGRRIRLPSGGSSCPRISRPRHSSPIRSEPERLDVFSQFLSPAGVAPRRHTTIETTDIMLQLVASGRGACAALSRAGLRGGVPERRRCQGSPPRTSI